MSAISDAVKSKSGDDLVKFLVNFPYKGTSEPDSTQDDAERYNDLLNPGVGGGVTGTISEVATLANTGMLDPDVYLEFLRKYNP